MPTTYTFSDRPLPDPADYENGWKAPRVLSWGRIRRAKSSIFDGQPERSDVTVEFTDTDRFFRELDDQGKLLGSPVVIKTITDVERRQELPWYTVFRGLIQNAIPFGTLKYRLVLKDWFHEMFLSANLVPKRTYTTEDFPQCGVDKVSSSAEGYSSGVAAMGDTTVTVSGGVGVFAPGSLITFSGHSTQYTVSDSSLQDPENDITFSPALTVGVSGDTITQLPNFTVTPKVGWRVRFGYGAITDYQLDGGVNQGDGQGYGDYLGDEVWDDGHTYAVFAVYGHAVYAPDNTPIIMFSFWNNSLETGQPLTVSQNGHSVALQDLSVEAAAGGRIKTSGYSGWAEVGKTLPYDDRNGRRYTLYGLRGIYRDWALGILKAPDNLGGIPHSIDHYGADTNGDGTGQPILRILQQYKHTLKNWARPDGLNYESGPWLDAPVMPDDATLSMLDEASFDAADAQSEVYVPDTGFEGAWMCGFNNEAIPQRDLIARLNISAGVQSGPTRKSQFKVDMLNRDLASITQAPSLTYVRDVFSGTFSIDPKTDEYFTRVPWRATQDVLGREPGGWRSTIGGIVETGSGLPVLPQPILFYMLRGKHRDSDWDGYIPGNYTIAAVLALLYARLSSVQHIAKLTTGPKGMLYDLGDVFELTHYEGLSSAGWTDEPLLIEREELDLSQMTQTLEAYQLEPVLL